MSLPIDIHTLRFNESSTVDAMQRIENRCFLDPWQADAFAEIFRSKFWFCLVARVGMKVCGYIVFQRYANEIDILNLAVDDEFRRIGVASSLLDEVHSSALQDCEVPSKRMTCHIRESNLAGQQFFRCLGFRAVEVMHNYYDDGQSAYRLQKWLINHDKPLEPANRLTNEGNPT